MKSIVFDNAGTILKRVTALKDMYNNNLIYETNTIDIVNQKDESLLLVFQTPTKELIQNDMKIVDYLKENPDSFEISYSRKKYGKTEIINSLKEDNTTLDDIKESAYALIKKYDIEICSGSALIVDMKNNKIDYAYTAGGMFFPDTRNVFKYLKKIGYDIYIASGDNKQSLSIIANILKVPESNIHDTCNIDCKRKVVENLQKKYEQVIMVGNNTNDYKAIKQSDIGIISVEQGEKLPKYLLDSSDYVIDNIGKILKIVNDEELNSV